MICVKNLIGTSDNRVPNDYSSWLDYWEKEKNQKANQCSASDCSQSDNLVGAHVKKVGSDDNSWYIVPLCQSCNMSEREFLVNENLLVPVR
ncbi:MAG: hypothetical protein LBR17_02395 [Bacteroidales bacterium]|jgi:hypothetical protein|nr:hypothetical protein [Bacteroidales bacterium]